MSKKLAITAILASSLPLMSGLSFAADDATASGDVIDEVTVTGSHISRAREEMSIPVDVFDRDEFEAQGSPDALDIIQNMPAASGSDNRTDQYTGSSNITGQQNINMRGLGLGRTLVLINGHRAMPSVQNGAGATSPVDIGSYPTIALKRIELLKNGGSTIYGSDAIAGVFNYITRDDFEGIEIQASHSDMSGNSGDNKFSAIGGWAGDKWNFVVSAEYEDRSGLSINDAHLSVDPNPDDASWTHLPTTYGNPGTYALYNPVSDTINFAAGIVADPACGTKYGDAQTFVQGGFCKFYFTEFTNVTDEAERKKLFLQGRFDIDDEREVYGSFLYSEIDAQWVTSPSYTPTNQGVNAFGVTPPVVHPTSPGLADFLANANYPFGPAQEAAFQSLGAANGLVFIGRVLGAEGPGLSVKKEFEKYNFTIGSRGAWTDSVSYDATFSYQRQYSDEPNAVELLTANYRNALQGLGGDNCSGLDADRGNAAAGCLWFNPFASSIGADPSSPLANSDEVYDYMFGSYTNKYESTIMVADLVFSGELPFAELPGGTVDWAAGAQLIDTKKESIPYGDNNAALYPEGYNAFGFLGTTYYNEIETTTKSVFVETSMPILDTWIVDVGFRYVDYEEDSVTTPKLSTRWDAADWIAIRASYEEGFRRPILPSRTSTGWAASPEGGGKYITRETPVPTSLLPEESDNFSVGAIFNLKDGLSFSVDYWDITLTSPFASESIGSVDAERVYDPVTGELVKVITELTNGGDVELSGFDFEADYTWDMGNAAWQVGANGTYLSKYDLFDKDTGAREYDAVGKYNYFTGGPIPETGPKFRVESLPDLKTNLYVTMMKGQHFARLYARYISSLDVASKNSAANGAASGIKNSDEIDSMITYDLHYTYAFAKSETTLSVSALNLLDEEAPAAPYFFGYDARTHSPLGRVVKLSVKHAF